MTRKHKLVLAATSALLLAGAGAGAALAFGTDGSRTSASANARAGVAWAYQGRPSRGARGFPGVRGFGFGFGFAGSGGLMQAAASYLGVSVSTLSGDLRSGKSLADVANGTPGKSASELVSTLVAAVKAKLAAAVTAGKLSSAQESKLEANLQQRITDLVNAKRPAVSSPRGFGFGFGFGRHGWGPPPSGNTTA
jgi:hypothetical protein